jgi:hypothetical protein
VRSVHGLADVVLGDHAVRAELGITGNQKCPDVLGKTHGPSPRHVAIGESKSTDVPKTRLQLGNAAAAVHAKYGVSVNVRLLLFAARLTPVPVGMSPGPGYVIQRKGNYDILGEAKSQGVFVPARAIVEIQKLSLWSASVGKLDIELVVDHP